MAENPKPFDQVSVEEGLIWKYEVVLRAGRPEHIWCLIGDAGAIHIHASLSEWDGRKEWIGGIECHFASAQDYMDPEKPSHDHCWLLGKPCWHDGTSLGFSEQVAPMLPFPHNPDPHAMHASAHGYVDGVLRRWFRGHLSQPSGDEA